MDADEGELLFGPFMLSLAPRELRLGGRPVPLGTWPLGLLALLAGRAGEVIGKEEIAARLWAGASTQASRLRAHFATLRRALGDGEDGSRYIVNVLGRGYVFVAPVRRVPPCARPAASGLPPGAEPLLGRDEALALLDRLVRERRLVSIVGAGGLGKSALALAVARRAGADFPGGVTYLDLAPLSDGTQLGGALAAAVGLDAQAPWPALCATLARRRQLLVLDNCGHLADAAALLAEAVLDAAPQLHLLATSREALCLRAEWVHRLAPLGLPRPALDLFAVRYGAGQAADLDPASQARAAQLCRQLDGNPLLICLAAARARTVGIAALADCLDALFEPDGGAPELGRHRSPDALLDWSCRLLGPNERTVLRRLAAFCQPFTLDQAIQACRCPRLDGGAVVEAILALGARSLVELDLEDGQDGARYRLSNATRRYAGRRLAPADTAAQAGTAAGAGPAQAVVTSSVERIPA